MCQRSKVKEVSEAPFINKQIYTLTTPECWTKQDVLRQEKKNCIREQ